MQEKGCLLPRCFTILFSQVCKKCAPQFLSRRAVEETVYFRILAHFKFGREPLLCGGHTGSFIRSFNSFDPKLDIGLVKMRQLRTLGTRLIGCCKSQASVAIRGNSSSSVVAAGLAAAISGKNWVSVAVSGGLRLALWPRAAMESGPGAYGACKCAVRDCVTRGSSLMGDGASPWSSSVLLVKKLWMRRLI